MNPPIYCAVLGSDVEADQRRRRGRVGAPALRWHAAARPAAAGWIKKNWIGSVNIVTGYFSAIQPLTELIYTGLFERFPTLKFVHAEVDWGWMPFWAEIMDQVVRQHNYWVDWPMTAQAERVHRPQRVRHRAGRRGGLPPGGPAATR